MKEIIKEIPEEPGVYFFFDSKGEILYIGKSICLRKRIMSYFKDHKEKVFKKVERDNYNDDNRLPMFTWDYTAKFLDKVPSLVFDKEHKKKKRIKRSTSEIRYIVTETEEEALTLEGCLISTFRPSVNRMMWKYPFIEVTLGEEIPRIITAYQILHPESYIYGPFNIAANIDIAMDGFLMVYPLCVHDNPIKISQKRPPNCIKHQIKRCIAPCKDSSKLSEYIETVHRFIEELENNGRNVLRILDEQMKTDIQQQNFEGAAIIRDRIQAIEVLFHEKAVPNVLQKYYSEVMEITNDNITYKEIINKILENNGFERK